jgi:hypothetical protein
MITVDRATLDVLARIQRTNPEVESRSAAVRYMARWYKRMEGQPLNPLTT